MTKVIIISMFDFQFGCMKSFDALIPFESKVLDVHFNTVVAPLNKYFIEVSFNNKFPVSFEMQIDQYSKWKILHPFPDWIMNLENLLANAISQRGN